MEKQKFLNAIAMKNKIQLKFFSKEDSGELIRLCAPMDYGPSKRANDNKERYHFWNFGSDENPHTLSILPSQIIEMEVLSDFFDPSEFVTWPPMWIINRDWGSLS